ncbi:MAG: type II secretion system F family protein, partial [Thermoguttaceae bacterium]
GINLFIADVMEAQRQQAHIRLEEELRARQKERARGSLVYKELYEMAAEGLVDVQVKPTITEKFTKLVDESGLLIKPGRLLLVSLCLSLLLGASAGLLSHQWILGAIAAPFGFVLPMVYVAYMRKKRQDKLLSQLPEAFDLMSRSMRAGQTISQALQSVSEEFNSPISDEFGFCYDQQNLGLSPEAAMRDLARRTGLLELKIFVLAVMVHRQTGGSLSDLLEKLSTVIRDRYRIRGIINALTAEGRLQAMILLALPPLMMFVMLCINRSYTLTLFQYPSLLLGVIGMMAIGALWIHKIIRPDF